MGRQIIKFVVMAVGLIVLAAGVYMATDGSSAGGVDGDTSWQCQDETRESATDLEEVEHYVECKTTGGEGVIAPAVPITTSLLGLGLVVGSVTIGQTVPPRRSTSTAPGTPSQPTPPQPYGPPQAYPGRPPQGQHAPQPPPPPQGQPNPHGAPRGDEPSSG